MIAKRLSTGIRYKSAAELNCRIAFARAVGQQIDGTPKAATVLKSNVAANVAIWRGKESTSSQQRNASSSYKITVRYNKNFVPTSNMIILYHGQTYNIETVSDIDGQHIQLEIWAWIENDGTGA